MAIFVVVSDKLQEQSFPLTFSNDVVTFSNDKITFAQYEYNTSQV